MLKLTLSGLAIASISLSFGVLQTNARLHPAPTTEDPAAKTAHPTVQLAQQSRVRRIQFAPGATSAIVGDAVVRGTRDIYLIGASKGQAMTVKISSLENNAVFDLKTPANRTGQRRTLKQETVNWAGKLPESGDYQVIVGGTRGNASYKLQVTIK